MFTEKNECRKMNADTKTQKRSPWLRRQPGIWFLSLFLLLAAFAALPVKAMAAQEINLNLPTGSDAYLTQKRSDPFTLIMEEEDMIRGYHHAYTGSETSREVYVKMNLAYPSEIWLGITLPMILQGKSFSAVSYDLLKADRKTVICSYRRALSVYGMTQMNLFRGVLPKGTYYLRLHDYYDGDCEQATQTCLNIEYFTARPSLVEDDLQGSNNSRQTAAPLGDRRDGYLSILGDDPADWYSFTVGEGGAVLKAAMSGEGCLSAAVYRKTGEVVQEKTWIYDEVMVSPMTVELEEGAYYVAVFFDEYSGEGALPRRGGAYYVWQTANQTLLDSGTCGKKLTWELWKRKAGTGYETTLQIKGTGAMTDYSGSSEPPWSSQKYSINHVTVGYGVTSIGSNAFAGCSLKDISLPSSLKKIEKEAFQNCSYLESIRIPDKVTAIGTCAFFACDRLAKIVLPASLNTLGTQVFDYCRSLERITVPGSLKKVSYGAFGHCLALSKVTLSPGVTELDEYAFGNCEALKSIVLPDTVTRLQAFVFDKCTSLESVTIPAGLADTMIYVFTDCGNLKDVYYGGSKSMWEKAYWSKGGDLAQAKIHFALVDPAADGTILKSGSASYEVTGGGKKVIYRKNTGSSSSVNIPASVKLKGVTYKVSSVASGAFQNKKKLKTVTIGSNVTSIGSSAFAGCTKLQKVTIGKNVKSINSNAFKGCTALTSVVMGAKVTTIGEKAFYNCKVLAKITIPSKVSKIGKSAFQGCVKLKTITIKTTKLTSAKVGANAFKGTTSGTAVTVPKQSLAAYKKWLVKKGLHKNAKIKS